MCVKEKRQFPCRKGCYEIRYTYCREFQRKCPVNIGFTKDAISSDATLEREKLLGKDFSTSTGCPTDT
jgi:hypothetical protein